MNSAGIPIFAPESKRKHNEFELASNFQAMMPSPDEQRRLSKAMDVEGVPSEYWPGWEHPDRIQAQIARIFPSEQIVWPCPDAYDPEVLEFLARRGIDRPEDIGTRLREWWQRYSAGKPRKALAVDGLSPSTISEYFKGNHAPTAEAWVKLMKAMEKVAPGQVPARAWFETGDVPEPVEDDALAVTADLRTRVERVVPGFLVDAVNAWKRMELLYKQTSPLLMRGDPDGTPGRQFQHPVPILRAYLLAESSELEWRQQPAQRILFANDLSYLPVFPMFWKAFRNWRSISKNPDESGSRSATDTESF